MMSSKCSYKDCGLFLIRLALAIVFIAHGAQKLGNMSMTTAFFAQLGFPAFLAWVVALGEFLSGVAMLFGKFTKWAGYLIAAIMVVAIISAKRKMGFFGGWEYDLSLLLTALGVACAGPGSMAVCGSCGCGSSCKDCGDCGDCKSGKRCTDNCCSK